MRRWLDDWYVEQREPEQWVGDLKLACFADGLSCDRSLPNQFRLLLDAAASRLPDALRRWLTQLRAGRMQLYTQRQWLLQLGGVREMLARVRLHVASVTSASRSGTSSPRAQVV